MEGDMLSQGGAPRGQIFKRLREMLTAAAAGARIPVVGRAVARARGAAGRTKD